MAPPSFDEIPANQNGDNRVKPTNQNADQEITQPKPSQSAPRTYLVDDYQNDCPSPRTIPSQPIGPDEPLNADQLDHDVAGPTPNTGEKIIESPTVSRPTAKIVAHSILAHHNQHRLDVKRPRKSLSWDLPHDRVNQPTTKHVPTDRLPDIVSQPPSSASDETARDAPDRSFWPDRLQSSPAPMEDPEQGAPPKPQEFPWWQRGPFYNDYTTGRNHSRVGSIASTSHKPSFSSDFIPRAPSISSQHWNDSRGRLSRRGSSIGWRSRCSSYVPDVCHDAHCHFHRYPHSMHYSSPARQDSSFGCACHTCYNRRHIVPPSDDFSLYERSATSTTFDTSDISTQNPPKTPDGREDRLEEDSDVRQRRQQLGLLEEDLRDMQDEMFDVQRDVAELERQRSMVEQDVDYLLRKRLRLEAQIDQLNVQAQTVQAKPAHTVDMDEILRKHLDRMEELASGRPVQNAAPSGSTRPSESEFKASTLQSNPDLPGVAKSSPASAALQSEHSFSTGNVSPNRSTRPACVIFTEPSMGAQQYIFPISQCQTWNGMKSMILQSMKKYGPANPQCIRVVKDEFDLKDQDGRVITPQAWQFLVHSDMHVTLAFWSDSQPTSSPTSSPLPGADGSDGQDDASRVSGGHALADKTKLQGALDRELDDPEYTPLTDSPSSPQSLVETPFEEIAQPNCDVLE